jgi:hypothetical protein
MVDIRQLILHQPPFKAAQEAGSGVKPHVVVVRRVCDKDILMECNIQVKNCTFHVKYWKCDLTTPVALKLP